MEASEVVKGIDLSGKTFLVTGASSGLGRATTHALLLAGAHVILGASACAQTTLARADPPASTAVRRPEAGEQAAAELRDKAGNGSTDVLQLDLSSLKSVRSAAKAILARNKPLHAVICNAGAHRALPCPPQLPRLLPRLRRRRRRRFPGPCPSLTRAAAARWQA